MSLSNILNQYHTAADRALELLQRERESIERVGELDATLSEKRSLIDELGGLAQHLRAYRENGGTMTSANKESVVSLQQKMMRILKLDRAVEKSFLSRSVSVKVPAMVPSAGRVGQVYARHV